MYEQLELDMFLKDEKYCFDDDINKIHKKLIEIAKKYGLQITNDEFQIWEHVPRFGYRMDLGMKITKEIFSDKNFQKDVGDVVEYAKVCDVELSTMWAGAFFFKEEETTLLFYTTFLDKERRKIK